MKSGTCPPALMIAACALVTSGCTGRDYVNTTPSKGPTDIEIEVAAKSDCSLSLEVTGSPCIGVGRTNGVVCGRPRDTVRWLETKNTTVHEITILDGKSRVCSEDQRRRPGKPFVCRLRDPRPKPAIFKYAIEYSFKDQERCPVVDPYIIIVMK